MDHLCNSNVKTSEVILQLYLYFQACRYAHAIPDTAVQVCWGDRGLELMEIG